MHAPDIRTIDLLHQGRPQVIAAACFETSAGPVVVDPGPTADLPALRRGLAAMGVETADLHALLLTHIHLDHAGATGTLARAHPALKVFVHQRGARHLADPSRLVESATRLYGALMEPLWGEIAPVPGDQLVPLTGDETLRLGDRRVRVAYTPGHASHHVSLLDETTGTAFTGDTAGIRIEQAPYVMPPTPPPDIDLEAWNASLDRLTGWAPARLLVTHFGLVDDPANHLDWMRDGLRDWSERVRISLAEPGDDPERARRFAQAVVAEISRRLPGSAAADYARGGSPEMSWHGLARYWRRRASQA